MKVVTLLSLLSSNTWGFEKELNNYFLMFQLDLYLGGWRKYFYTILDYIHLVKQARKIEQESGTLMHILSTGEHALYLEQLCGCLFQPLYTVHL